jgi:predicted small lipoprotein YifL
MKHMKWILTASAALAAAACGQKGPLYLPDHNGSVVTRPAGTAPQPSPQGQTPQESAPQGSTDTTKQKTDKNDGSQPPK